MFQFHGGPLPMRTPGGARSQRGYIVATLPDLDAQSSQFPQAVVDEAENITYVTPWGSYIPYPPSWGNLPLFRGMTFHSHRYWRPYAQPDWDALRASGVGYGLWLHHQPSAALPVAKLTSPGLGGSMPFVLPNTFLGQPLPSSVRPLGQPR